jgi:hypothetical protein
MDIIDEKLTMDSLDRAKLDSSIRASLGLAKKTLNRYYNMTDWSEVYRIAMGACMDHEIGFFIQTHIAQCSIHGTSLLTSRLPAGKMSG